MAKQGLYANIHDKQARVAAGAIDPDTGKISYKNRYDPSQLKVGT